MCDRSLRKKVNPLPPLGVFGTFSIKVATKAPVEEPMLQPSKLAPQSSNWESIEATKNDFEEYGPIIEEVSDSNPDSDESDNEREIPKLRKINLPKKNNPTPSSDSEDAASDSSMKSTSSKPRQQLGKKLKYMSSRIDAFGENTEKFEEKLLGIVNNAKNISENISTMNTEHKASISSLSSSIEKNSKTVSKFMEMQISHEISSKDLKKELEKSQELSVSLDKELKNSQKMQEESSRKVHSLEGSLA